ncbi:putative clathrin assembly protein At5g35200 [Triticum dicoccoides]|uniref:putative clathrin assembly protein At5g35200 n=1 Tax=Triticum dicoccoides TaxID=85692 RepID=UPI000E787475|nr:putative clathrin assembly protein At5g35200 [Triticum dicoccoides]XP_037453507.1 putative clathrin assembly protein At5g35200 [Triticum dicoccoides]
MAGGGTSIRKYVGALKDSTTVSIAKVNSDYKQLDIAIVKATNHVERPAKEKYIRDIFMHLNSGRARADVAYCIRALARRLSKTRNWAVALKTLIVIHRALREVDPSFRDELVSYGRSSGQMLHMSYFKDDSSPDAWDHSAWIRNYALFLEERLESFRVLNYDVELDPLGTRDVDTTGLLAQLPALSQLLFRLISCQPHGSSSYNTIIQHALSMVATESVRIQTAINDGILNLVDKFFDMHRDDAIRALDIYKKALKQAGQLSGFYETCKTIHIGRDEKLLTIEQPPASFLQAMEDYVRDAPLASKNQAVLAIEYNRKPEEEEASTPPPPPPQVSTSEKEPEPEPVKKVVPRVEQIDLLGMDEPIPDTSELDQNNALALAIVEPDNAPKAAASSENVATSWELALVTAPSASENVATSRNLAGGLDLLTLDSLYDDAHRHTQQNASYNPWEQPTPASSAPMAPMMQQQYQQQPMHNPLYASAQQQQAFMLQQQQAFVLQQQHQYQQQYQQMMMMGAPSLHRQASSNPSLHRQASSNPSFHRQASSNPFDRSYVPAAAAGGGGYPYAPAMQLHTGNAYNGTGMM